MSPPRRRQRFRGRPAAGDGGYSLIEVVVAMTIMFFVTVVIVGATSNIYSGTKRIDNTAEARDQLDNSFRRLDRELRYASWVGEPELANDAWSLRFATPDGCRQLKLELSDKRRLSMATRPLASTTWSNPMFLAGALRVVDGTKPFSLLRAGDQPYATASSGSGMGSSYRLVFQQVRLYFNVEVGTVTLPFDSIFTAQNTDLSTPKQHECGG